MQGLYTHSHLSITMVLGKPPNTVNCFKEEGFLMKAKAKDITRIGYVCDCPLGSPKQHWVILVPSLHERTCHVRKALAEMSYSKGDVLNN